MQFNTISTIEKCKSNYNEDIIKNTQHIKKHNLLIPVVSPLFLQRRKSAT